MEPWGRQVSIKMKFRGKAAIGIGLLALLASASVSFAAPADEVKALLDKGNAAGAYALGNIGGTNPTNSAGQVGTFIGGAFNVNFVTQTLTVSTPLTFTMPGGLSYSLTTCTSCTYSSPTASFISNPATLSGLCTGGSCSTGSVATGILNGGFTGAAGQGLVTSSGISAVGVPLATFSAAFMR